MLTHSPVPYPSNPLTNLASPQSNQPHQHNQHEIPTKCALKMGIFPVCNGYRKSFTNYNVVVVQHAEHRHYTNPQAGLPASEYGNAYYHPLKRCIQLKWGTVFDPSNLVIPDAARNKLTTPRREQLYLESTVL